MSFTAAQFRSDIALIEAIAFDLFENTQLSVPSVVHKAIKRIGGKLYQIGGVVRDEMIGKVSKDLDLLVVGVDLKRLAMALEHLGKVNLVGKSFGVIKFTPTGDTEEIDIAVPRVDEKSIGQGHKDFIVRLGKDISLKQDQLRRDFWMNAIAKDVDTGQLHDIEGKGMADIKNKEIRMISAEAFREDPLRMLRAVQFAARFDFKIERETLAEIRKNASKIKSVSPSRFEEEFKKLFNKSDKPSIGVKYLFRSGLMRHIFPKIKSADYQLLDKFSKKDFPAFLAVLTLPYGDSVKDILWDKMRLSNDDANAAQNLAHWIKDDPRSNLDIVLFNKDVLSRLKSPKSISTIDAYQKVVGKKDFSSMLKDIKVSSFKDLPITGRDLAGLGLNGTAIGKALKYALKYAIETGKNDKESLIAAIKKEFNLKEGKIVSRYAGILEEANSYYADRLDEIMKQVSATVTAGDDDARLDRLKDLKSNIEASETLKDLDSIIAEVRRGKIGELNRSILKYAIQARNEFSHLVDEMGATYRRETQAKARRDREG